MSPMNSALFAILVSVIASVCNGYCPRNTRVAVVYDGAFLLKELTTSKLRRASQMDWFLPNTSMATDPIIFKTVSNLVAMMKQRSNMERLQESNNTVVICAVLNSVINDSCEYLNGKFGLTMDCSDATDIEDLHTRLQIVQAFSDAEGVLKSNRDYFDFAIGGKGYRYAYWNDRVVSSCGSTCSNFTGKLFNMRHDPRIC